MLKVKTRPSPGTLESSDSHGAVEPGSGIELSVSSSVINQYGKAIRASVLDVLSRLKVEDVRVTVVDRGASTARCAPAWNARCFGPMEIAAQNVPWGRRLYEAP